MPKRKRKILMGSGGHPPINIRDLDWELMEKAYGLPLPPAVRGQIEEASVEFVSAAAFELTVAPVAEAQKEVNRILSAVEQLIDALATPSKTVDGAHYAKHLLRNHIRSKWLPDPTVLPYQDPLSAISQILTSLVIACHRSFEELDNPDYSVQEGEAWERWIRSLTALFASAALPTGARKDNPEASPFVALVRELQKCLPADFQRHTHSDLALSKAIGRAREATRDDKLQNEHRISPAEGSIFSLLFARFHPYTAPTAEYQG
jgi:hypothetical protein